MKKILEKLLVVILGIGILAGIYWFAYNHGKKAASDILSPMGNSEAIIWVTENPQYAEKLYQAYQKHVQAAEAQLGAELEAIGGVTEIKEEGKE